MKTGTVKHIRKPSEVQLTLTTTEFAALKTICSDWRQMVRHSNRHSLPEWESGSDVMNEYIDNVRRHDPEEAELLSIAESVCLEII